MSVRKKQVILYIEFFKPQDIEKLEKMIKSLVDRKMFPPIYTLIPMISYRNMKQIKPQDFIKKTDVPLVTSPTELGREDDSTRIYD